MDLHIARTMSLIYRKTIIYCRTVFSDLELSLNDVTVLVYICRNEGIIQGELSRVLALDAAAVTRSLKLLEARGLIRRCHESSNLRSKHLYATETGNEYRKIIEDRMLLWNSFIMRNLSETEAEQASDLLTRIRDDLEGVDPLDVVAEFHDKLW